MEDVATVRRLVGKDKIVGVSVNNMKEALEAMKIEAGADYLGRALLSPGLIFQESALFMIPQQNV
jgi:thiamine monophosphate synthase